MSNKILEKVAGRLYSGLGNPDSVWDPDNRSVQEARYRYLTQTNRADLYDPATIKDVKIAGALLGAPAGGVVGASTVGSIFPKNRYLRVIAPLAIGAGAGALIGRGIAGAHGALASQERYDEIKYRAIRDLAIREALRLKALETQADVLG